MSSPRTRIMIRKPGGYGAFGFDDSPIFDPGEGEVQVSVRACGINFADISVRMGLYAAARGMYPLCPGLEFAGVVRRTGRNVRKFAPGDRVFGATRFGGYATMINCPADYIWSMPETWDFNRGAAFAVAYLTACHAIHHVGRCRPGETVLVHSAAGGVGTALLQLLKINGNLSVGVVGASSKVPAAEKAGASRVIDKSREPLWRRAEAIAADGFDLILDANGLSTLRESYRHLKPGGRLLVYGFASMFSHAGRKRPVKLAWDYFRTPRFNPFRMTGDNKTVSGFNLIYLFENAERFRSAMDDLLKWDAEGRLPPMPIRPFPFRDVADAHRHMASGRSVGKLVLVV